MKSFLYSLTSFLPFVINYSANCQLGDSINSNCRPQLPSLLTYLRGAQLSTANSQSQSQSHIATDGQSVSKSWCRTPSGAHGQIFISVWQLRSWFVERPLWREDGSAFCICSWPLPAQSFSGPSPLGLAIIYYVSDLRISFSSPPTARRVTVDVFDLPILNLLYLYNNFAPTE
jgi:hypothetical protein